MRWPAQHHSRLEQQRGTLNCGVQTPPCPPLPPVPSRGHHPGHRILVSQHAQTSQPFCRVFSGSPDVLKLKMEFSPRCCSAGTHLHGAYLPGHPAGHPRLPAPLQPERRGERRERRIRGRAADPCPPRLRGPGRDISTKGPRSRRGWRRRRGRGFSLGSAALPGVPASGKGSRVLLRCWNLGLCFGLSSGSESPRFLSSSGILYLRARWGIMEG